MSITTREDPEMDFTITQMTVINAPKNRLGNSLLATFDLRLPVLKIVGFVMILKDDGRLVVEGPRGTTAASAKIEVTVDDADFRSALTARAVAAYEGATGKSVAAE